MDGQGMIELSTCACVCRCRIDRKVQHTAFDLPPNLMFERRAVCKVTAPPVCIYVCVCKQIEAGNE